MAVTLLQMRDAAKDLCDHVSNPNVSDANWTKWINDGIERLYRIATRRSAGAFQTSTASPYITLTAASNLIAKPATFRGLIGVTLDPGSPSMRRSLPKYMMGERDSLGPLGPRSYRVVGQNIAIEPANLCAGVYALHFIAGPTVLAADGTTIDVVLEPFVDYPITWAATKALGKEESDTRDLYGDLREIETQVDEFFAFNVDGGDPEGIVDDTERGPSLWYPP